MTISSNYAFDPQRDAIIKRAIQLAGQLMAGQEPDPDQLVFGRESLQAGVVSLQKDGVVIRTVERYPQTLTADDADYDVPEDTIDVGSKASVRDTSSVDTDVYRISREDYLSRSLKTVSGRPTEFYFEKTTTGGVIYLYPVPTSTDATFIYQRVRKLRDMDTGSATLDLEPKWVDAMTYKVAADFAVHTGMLARAKVLREMFESERDRAMLDEAERGRVRFVVGD